MDVECRRLGLQPRHGARDLAALVVEPARLAPVLGPEHRLVALQDERVENAVGQRLQRQRGDPRPRLCRNDLVSAGFHIQIFDDHAAVVDDRSVIEDQCGNLAERVLLTQAVGSVHRIGHLDAHPAGKAEMIEREFDLAAERRKGRRAQNERHALGFPMPFEGLPPDPAQALGGRSRGRRPNHLSPVTGIHRGSANRPRRLAAPRRRPHNCRSLRS